MSIDNVVSGTSRAAMVKLIRDEHKRYKEDVKDFSVFFPKDTESLEVLFTFFDLDENDTYENWLNAIEDNETPAAIHKESELYRYVLTETFWKTPRIDITYNELSRLLKSFHVYCMKKSKFNDSVDRVFNYSLSYESASASFKQNPAELISDGYAIQVFKPIVDTLPKEVKDDLHTRFGSQARYGFCYFHVEYVITSRRALVTTVSIFPAETLTNYRRRTGSVDSKVSYRESANHNLSKGSSKLEERQPSGSLIQKFKDRFKEGECLACGTGKFSPDHNCKATKFYQEEAKNFVKSSEFKQLKSNQKISFKDSPKSKMPSGDSRSKPLGELDRKGSKETS